MPIQIIDNFDLGASKPIDNRIVVGSQSFYTNKDNITHKYPGMRVWDLDLNIPFVWTGVTFSTENSSNILGSGSTGYIPKFDLSNVVSNSIIFQDIFFNIGIGTLVPGFKLDVSGDIRTSTNFRGSGQFITNLNATNVSSGLLSLQRITNGTTGQLLVAGTSQPQWTNTNQITVGTSSAVIITNDTSSASTNYLTFVSSTSGSSQIKVSSSKLQFVPNTGTLYVSGNVGLGTSPGTEKLKVLGSTLLDGGLSVTSGAILSGSFRCNVLSGSGAFTIGLTSLTNLDIQCTSTSALLKLINPANASQRTTSITQFANYSEYLSSGRTYFNLLNSDERLLTFGRSGQNDQVRIYMDNSTSNVPSVGGKGVYVEYNLRVNGTLSKSSGTFQIEHPLESKRETHTLVHSFIEGPQADLIYRGKVSLKSGKAEVNIDQHSRMTDGTFESLVRDVQCFTSNETGWTAVKGEVDGNILKISSVDSKSKDVISWLVIGERKDKHMMETNWTDDNGKVIVEPEI